MKELLLIIPLVALLSCKDDLKEDVEEFNKTASFKINVDGITYEINDDAKVEYTVFTGPGSAMYYVVDSYEPLFTHFQFDALSTRATVPNVIASVRFDLYTTSTGEPLNEITVGTYSTVNAQFYTPDLYFTAFNNNDPEINKLLGAEIAIKKVEGNRIDGTFSGEYYQAIPETGRVITITGEFKDVRLF